MRAFSLDLRRRVLHAALAGDATHQRVADRFGVSLGYVRKVTRHLRRTGSPLPPRQRYGPAPALGVDDRAALAALVAAQPDATLDELGRALTVARGVAVSERTLGRALAALSITRKKRRSAPVSATGPTSRPSGRPS